jgi:hypothetical protein
MLYNSMYYKSHMARQQIIKCLEEVEKFLGIEHEECPDMPTRILDLSFHVHSDPLNYQVIEWILQHNVDSDKAYQQCVYQLLGAVFIGSENENEIDNYIKILFGENQEYLIHGYCMFTDELRDKVYDIMARDHHSNWRAGYFEPEDLDDIELGRHNEYVAYVNDKYGDDADYDKDYDEYIQARPIDSDSE